MPCALPVTKHARLALFLPETTSQERRGISKMRPVNVRAALLFFASCVAFAQTTAATPSFEVATIKPAAPPATSMGPGGGMRIAMRMGAQGGPGTSDPGQITYSNMTLKSLMVAAYGVKTYQVSGPNWMDTERFDIVAKVPAGSTKDDVKLMLQNLLAERFKLTLHREKKDLPMYALVVGKSGPKMKESPPDDPDAKDAAGPKDQGSSDADVQKAKQALENAMRTVVRDGAMPQLPLGAGQGTRMMMMPGRMRMMATKQTMAQFAETLANQMDRPVVDQTGLTKNYDFTLDFAPDAGGKEAMGIPLPPPPPSGGDGGMPRDADSQAAPSLFTALQEQMGLRLEQKKGPVDLLVVDHLEKTPTEN
jgi:uncharacterized protein (TIGR03435 family)